MPAAMIVDVDGMGVGGGGVARGLRASGITCPLILLTQESRGPSLSEILRTDPNLVVLAKPIALSPLLERLSKLRAT